MQGMLPYVVTKCCDSIFVAADGTHRRGQTTLATATKLLLQHEKDRGKIMILPLNFVEGIVIKPNLADRPDSWTGPGKAKDQNEQKPDKTRLTSQIDPWPGWPGKTQFRPVFFFQICFFS